MGIFTVTKEIGPETILQRKGDLLFNTIDAEVVLLSIENSEYYGMDKVGSRIWDILEQPVSLKILIDKLMSEYQVSEQQCTFDTIAFLNKLREKKLVIIN